MIALFVLFFVAACILGRLWFVLGRRSPLGFSEAIVIDPKTIDVKKATLSPPPFFPGFDERAFLETAERNFRTLLFAYYRKDEKALKELVSPSLLKHQFNHDPKDTLDEICVTQAYIDTQELKGDIAKVMLHVVSQQVFSGKLEERTDLLTFEKNTQDEKAPWVLTAIRAD
jgi:hypothetical protein